MCCAMSSWVACTGLSNAVPAVGVSSQQPFTFGFNATDDDHKQQAADQDDAGLDAEEQTDTQTSEVNLTLLQSCDAASVGVAIV